MKRELRWLVFAWALTSVQVVSAFSISDLYPEFVDEWLTLDQAAVNAKLAAEPVLGEWNIGWAKCKAYAEANGVPMFMIWSSTGCSHCNAFDRLFKTEQFEQWVRENDLGKVVFCFSDEELPGEGFDSPAFNWAGGVGGGWSEGQFPWQGYLNNYPFVAFYWPANRIDYHLSGGDLTEEWRPDDYRLNQIYAAFAKWFAGYEPGGDSNKYGGVFAIGTEAGARLEAQPGFTTAIEVPLVRTNSVDAAGTNWLAYVYNDETSDFQAVSWAPGVERAYPVLELPPGFRSGDEIGLLLMTDDGEICDESSIACVTVENSPSNPYWIGEKKNVADLGFGEWTMDYALATNKVAEHNKVLYGRRSGEGKPAYTLLLLEGALWCPDCVATDNNFLEYTDPNTHKKPFIEWAKDNNIALVAYDIPNLRVAIENNQEVHHPEGEDYPALLKYDAFEKLGALRSGAGYLSRHMVSNDVAAATLAGFIDKAGELRTRSWPNPYRPGVPTLFLLNEDGSVAARLADFAVAGPTAYRACYIDRLNEMLESANDPCEEGNAFWDTTPAGAIVAARGEVTNSLCATDLTDVWRIEASGQFVRATVSGVQSAAITVSMFSADAEGNMVSIANPSAGNLATGVSVEGICPEGGAYISVTGNGAAFGISSSESTLRRYVLSTRNVLIPSETMASYQVGSADVVTVRLSRDVVYYIGGVSVAAGSAVERVGYNLYKVTATADVDFPVVPGTEVVSYGIATETVRSFKDVELVVKSHPNARLEMEQGVTQWVDVPVVRTNANSTGGITMFVSEFGESIVTQAIEWAAVDGNTAFVRVDAPASIRAGQTVTLKLLTLSGELLETGSITCVEPIGNSSVNPYWFGEKTEDTLNFGEWSMDLAVVTGKVARYNAANPGSKAHAIMVVQGALWCPNCWKMESNLWDRPEVKQWALDNKVVFGVVDIDPPPFAYGTAYPTLLTYDTVLVGHASGTEEEKYRSGAGYLSRHGATAGLAAECRGRNSMLVNTSVLEGGWCRPERMEKEWKTGLPMIILMRQDGSIAGRYDQFNNEGPAAFAQHLVYRLDELLATAEDPHEEANANWRTAGVAERVVADGGSKTATLSANDRVDTYGLVGTDMRLVVSLTGPQAGDVELKLISIDDNGTEAEMASVVGDLAEGVTITNQFGQVSNVFVVVTGLSAVGKTFSPLNEERATRTYTLTTQAVLMPGGTMAEYEVADAENHVTISVREGQVYYFEGVSEFDDSVFEKGEDENLYYCKRTAETVVTLSQAGGTVVYGQWESGRYGFTEEEGDVRGRIGLERTVYEAMDGKSKRIPITVHREGNLFGPSAIWVRLLASSTAVTDRYEWVDQKVEWASGVGGDKTVYFTLNDDDVFDPPPQTLTFVLAADEESSAEIEENGGTLTFSIVDDDAIRVGRLAITDASPAWSRNMTIIAEEGSRIEFVVTRENGTSKAVTAQLALKIPGVAPELSETLSWENRTRVAERTVAFTVPSYEAAKKAVVTIMPGDGIDVDPKRRSVTVQIVPASVPCFVAEGGRRDVSAWIGSAVSESIGVSNLVGYGAVTITKLSGSLPPGVTATYDQAARKLAVSGAPRKAGEYVAVYEVDQARDGSVVKGRTVSVRINVEQVDPSWFEGGSLNPALLTSRTYRNIMIVGPDAEKGTCLRGLLTLSLPKTGRLSAKYTCASGSYSFASDGWAGVDRADGLTATLACTKTGMSGCALSVVAAADGTVTVALAGVDDPAEVLEATAISTDWSEENSAETWSGRYNVVLKQTSRSGMAAPAASGYGYMALNMPTNATKTGQMLFAGCLPNGRTFSGSSTLLYDKSFVSYAKMPFFVVNSDEVLGGALKITKNAKVAHLTANNLFVTADESARPCWSGSSAGGTSCVAPERWNVGLTSNGGYYDPNLLCEDCSRRFQDGLFFLNGGATCTNAYYGTLGMIDPVEVDISDGTIDILQNDPNTNRLRLAFDLETGVFSGTMRLDFTSTSITGTFRGVIVPGWGGCDECGRLGALGSGALWFTDFLDVDGTQPEKNGFAVEINSPGSTLE